MGELLRWFIIYERKFLFLERSGCLLACASPSMAAERFFTY